VSVPLAGQPLLDLATLVERTKLSARTWRRLISAGKIGVLRIEGSVRIPEAEFERFLAERYVPPRQTRRHGGPQEVEKILDCLVPRRRGRPRIEAGQRQ
jgi:excisionase family DNA binding protein